MLTVKILLFSVMAQVFPQTTWTGGPGHFGPTPAWGDTFYTAFHITWNEFPTLLRLTGVIENLPEHMIDPTIGGWDNDPDVGDLDQDGDLDVIATDESNPDIVGWWENDGHGNFTKHIIDPDIYSVDEVFMADIDGDGDNDLVVASDPSTGKDLIWYQNDGQENFVGHVIDPNVGGSPEAEGVCVADMDHDGDMDVVASWLQGGLFWYQNDGQEHFTKRTIVASGLVYCWEPCAADFDGDGDADIVLTTRNALFMFVNNGADNPSFTQMTIFAQGTYGIWCKDMDHDGDLDIAVSGREYTNSLYWLENDGHASFTPHLVDATLNKPMGVHAVDVDPDGDVDIVVAEATGMHIYFYDNQGDMTFVRRTLASGRHFFGLFMGDLDNDGDVDVLIRAGTKTAKEGLLWYETRLWYDTPGELVSSVLDPGCRFIWETAYLGATVPPSTAVEVWVRSADDPQSIGTVPWGGPITTDGQSMNGLVDQSRLYFQYRITMSTTNRWYSPIVDSVAFSGYCDPAHDGVDEPAGADRVNLLFTTKGITAELPNPGEMSVYDAAGRTVFSGCGKSMTFVAPVTGVYTALVQMDEQVVTRTGALLGR